METSRRLFIGKVEKRIRKKGESLLTLTNVVVLSCMLERIPTIEEYKIAIKNIELNKFKT